MLNLLKLEFLTGYRTKIIGGGMILTGFGTILTHLASVIGGEQVNWETIKGGFSLVVTGFGLITASVHHPKP